MEFQTIHVKKVFYKVAQCISRKYNVNDKRVDHFSSIYNLYIKSINCQPRKIPQTNNKTKILLPLPAYQNNS